ncbi:MAG: alkaline phosphatase family protein [Verrucomicrobiota bacterium]
MHTTSRMVRQACWVSLGCAVLQLLPAFAAETGRGKAEHVVVLVWDGMRRDFITPQYTPNLCALARQGVFFNNHHPVFPTSTEVNGVALATGVYPNRSGMMANNDYRPELNFLGSIATEGMDNVRRGDLLTGGRYLQYATLPEILQQAGHSTIVSGSKPVAMLWDRAAKRISAAQSNSPVLFAGQSIPKSLMKQVERMLDGKKFPSTNSVPNSEKDAWTANAVIKGLWDDGVPKFTLIWLYDPDATQHAEGVGSDQALASIAHSDKCLADVLKALDEQEIRDKTDVIVISDHGFSNVKRGPDVVEALKRAKFKAVRKFDDPEPEEILVVGHGGAVSFYVVDHNEKVTRKLVEFLQGTDFAGTIFSRVAVEGAFSLETVRINTTNVTPDVVMSMRWVDEANENGVSGMFYGDGGARGKGSHASLSKYDLKNTLVAAGPDFKKGMVDALPSGNVDLTPTILWILGIAPPQPLDGRVLHEALVNGDTKAPSKATTKTLEADHDYGWFRWHQYLKVSQVGNTVYFDEGNGGMEAK